jgi:hypothetical protein
MSGVTDFVERFGQCNLVVRLKSKVQVDGCVGRGAALALPLVRDGVPRVFHFQDFPM